MQRASLKSIFIVLYGVYDCLTTVSSPKNALETPPFPGADQGREGMNKLPVTKANIVTV